MNCPLFWILMLLCGAILCLVIASIMDGRRIKNLERDVDDLKYRGGKEGKNGET